jgi:single-stranded-DNA-specific exonuclease
MWQKRPNNVDVENQLISQGKNRLLARIISQRKIDIESIDSFISAEYKDMSDPYSIHDMEKAVKIFIEVVKNKGAIATAGDYDADGIISSVMIKELCNTLNIDCTTFIPS